MRFRWHRPHSAERRALLAGVTALVVGGEKAALMKLFGSERQNPVPGEASATRTVIEALKPLAKPAVLLEDAPGSAAFRLGGLPRLPSPVRWPDRKGLPLAFLGELDLAAIRQAGGPAWLPAAGFLHIFYDTADQPWGFDPADHDGWAVLKTDRVAETTNPRPPGLADDGVFTGRTLGARRAVTYPTTERLTLPGEILSVFDFEPVHAFIDQDLGDGPHHQVGGYPSPIQSDGMQLESQLASNGVYMGGSDSYNDERIAALEPGAADWRLLLQLDSDDDAGMMWGDVGRLYVWVREQDARAGDFSRVWTVLQCT